MVKIKFHMIKKEKKEASRLIRQGKIYEKEY